MRALLILLCFVGLGVLGWHAVSIGTDQSRFLGAPQIETLVNKNITTAVSDATDQKIGVATDGRNVHLTGRVAANEDRQAILNAAMAVPLVGRLTDNIEVVPSADPFTFTASKTADGAVRLEGFVPDRTTEDRILADARAMAGGAPVAARLSVATGAPEGDWVGMASAGLKALSNLTRGSAALNGTEGVLEGEASDQDGLDAAAAALRTSPMGRWTNNSRGEAPTGGYRFTAMKTDDGGIVLRGFAPDESTQQDLIAQATKLSTLPVDAKLTIAAGMPSADWPDLVRQALDGLGKLEDGFLAVSGTEVSLSGNIDNEPAEADLLATIPDGWTTEVTVLNPTPPGDVVITLAPEGTTSVTGRLPEGVTDEPFLAALPGVDLSGIDRASNGRAQDWGPPLEGLAIVIPRLERAVIQITDKTVAVEGALKRGYSAAGATASLKTVLDRSWTLNVNLAESAPLAELIVSKRGPEVALSGVLPEGLAVGEALALFGDQAGGDALTGGGEGNAETWRRGLAALSGGLGLFQDASARIGGSSVELNGRLLPGYAANEAQTWLSDRIGDGWNVGLAAEESTPSDGDQRISLSSGESESFRRGFWLPDLDFPVSAPRCKQEVDAVLDQQKILFLTGSANIDQKGRTLLNRLAAVSVRCLNSSVLRLEIGGHTDSVGNDARNQRLSEARAGAVLEAMAERGVRAEAMSAVGYGESEPIASNNTRDGRTQNRRITFEWFETGD